MIPINPEAIGDPNATPVVYLEEEAGEVLGIRQRQPGLGFCAADYCEGPAAVYMAGPTLGASPRLTFIAGERARVLAASDLGGPLQLRCLDCAGHALDDLAAAVDTYETREGTE